MESQPTESQVSNNNIDRSIIIPDAANPVALDIHTCVCGKQCKGRRGLRSHQRACNVHKTLSTHSSSTNENNATASSQNDHSDQTDQFNHSVHDHATLDPSGYYSKTRSSSAQVEGEMA